MFNFQDPPFTVVTKDKDNDKITFVGGIIGEIWNTIQQNLGFKYTLEFS
jgi:hypothetical protein